MDSPAALTQGAKYDSVERVADGLAPETAPARSMHQLSVGAGASGFDAKEHPTTRPRRCAVLIESRLTAASAEC